VSLIISNSVAIEVVVVRFILSIEKRNDSRYESVLHQKMFYIIISGRTETVEDFPCVSFSFRDGCVFHSSRCSLSVFLTVNRFTVRVWLVAKTLSAKK